jgi:membrane-anchored protein YejM (alkaline phosphatase superfamily)
MVLNIITSPAAMDSFNINYLSIISVVFILITLVFIEVFLYKVAKKRESVFKKRYLFILLSIALFEKISYGIADIKGFNTIQESVRVIPLYQPLTFSKFAAKLGIKKRSSPLKNSINRSANLNYPLQNIDLKADFASPNIFIFFFDAVRNSIIDESVAPNIVNFSKDSLVFKNHISGGDATRFGIFSFFYSLNATYWFNFIAAKREPIFFEVLKKRGYRTKIISSTDTRWPEFRETVYRGVVKDILDKSEGEPYQKDRISADRFKDFIKSVDTKKPIFTFVFLDAPHGYSYPSEFEKFKPSSGSKGLNYINIDKENVVSYKNSYKNSILYDDYLFGEMIDAIKERGLYENSIIIFSADHGEEFFEYGSFGHNSSFSKAQINVPMIMKLPNSKHKEIKRLTSHLDIAPTLLKMLGVTNHPTDYSNGFDIFDPNYDRSYAYIAKWNKNAIYTEDFTYIFSNYPDEIFKNEIRRSVDYKRVSKKEAKDISKTILEVLDQNRRFLK